MAYAQSRCHASPCGSYHQCVFFGLTRTRNSFGTRVSPHVWPLVSMRCHHIPENAYSGLIGTCSYSRLCLFSCA
eukprot:9245474-Karenia_brevis.AAC.1